MSRPGENPAGWHPVDPLSLVAGLLAVGVAVLSLLSLDLDLDAGVVVAVLLVVAGGLGLAASLHQPDQQEALDP